MSSIIISELQITLAVRETAKEIIKHHNKYGNHIMSIACVIPSGFMFYNAVINEIVMQGYHNVECIFIVDTIENLQLPKGNTLYIIDTLLRTGNSLCSIFGRYKKISDVELKFFFLCNTKYQAFMCNTDYHSIYTVPDLRMYGYGLLDGINSTGNTHNTIYEYIDPYVGRE